MDAMNLPPEENGPGMHGCDREVFQRVWRRVMPVDTYGSPVQLIDEEPPTEAEGRYVDPGGHGPDPWLPEPPTPVLPEQGAVCLGPGSAAHGGQLQDFIRHELAACRRYLALARRCRGGAARTLGEIAADEKRHGRRLCTAYFLISGVRYWPEETVRPAAGGAMAACLRQAFLEEQRGEAAYRQAAAVTADPCLRELYLELAGEEAAHSRLLRGLLEGM